MTALMDTSGPLSGALLGRYRLGPLLGRGGMGEVYRGDDTELQRQVAIKVLPPSLLGDATRLSRFVQEARAASALNHPHLVAIYEIAQAQPDGSGPPVHFIAMELVRGETLRQMIDGRRTELRRTLDYLTQAADALAAAHAAGIIHRDLKPDNIMIADGGYAKVLDFGLAKLRSEPSLLAAGANEPTVTRAGPTRDSTEPGVVMGTIGYMSPEQAQGLTVDHRADVFAFGCVLYEAATGTRPFKGATAVDTLHQIIHAQPPALSQVAPSAPSELQRIVRKCLAKNPDERYQSMRDLALDLRDLRRELDSGSNASIVAPPVLERTRPRGWMAVVALLAVGVIAALGWYAMHPPPAGEAADPVVGLDIEPITRSGLVIDAVMSDDGRYVAYAEAQGGRQTLWLRQISGSRSIELLTTDGGFWGLAFSRDGTSVYYGLKTPRDSGTLFSIPTLGGTPRTVVKGMESAVTFSPDGTRIAYLAVDPHRAGESTLMIAAANGEHPRVLVSKRRPEILAPGFFIAPSWSPDGSRIAVAIRNSESRDARLALIDVNTGAEESFPHRYADATFAAWLPDGSAIALVGRMSGMTSAGNGGQIYLQPYPAGAVRRLTNDLTEYRTISFTRDGRSLLTVGAEANARMSIASITGDNDRRLDEDRFSGVMGVAWAPDGSRFYYTKVVQRGLELWTMKADGTDPRELIKGISGWITVTPDGRTLVFSGEHDNTPGIWRANADGSSRRLITSDVDPRYLAVTPDGQFVLFTSSREGPASTFKVSIEGGEATLVSRFLSRAIPSPDGQWIGGMYQVKPDTTAVISVLRASDLTLQHANADLSISSGTTSVSWSPDSRSMIFVTAERTNLWRQSVLGGPVEKLTDFTDLWTLRFALSPDGKQLLLCRGIVVRDAMLLTNFR